jgi:hypothetical protein
MNAILVFQTFSTDGEIREADDFSSLFPGQGHRKRACPRPEDGGTQTYWGLPCWCSWQ